MYISKIHIVGFRNFINAEIEFNEGVNVIIGHNNSGKTNLLKAISLVIDNQYSKRLDVDDFNKYISIEKLIHEPPKIVIEITITQSKEEDLNSDDLVTVGNWLIKLEQPYEAFLTYTYFLPEKESINYFKDLEGVTDPNLVWQIIKRNYIRLYSPKIYGGDIKLQNVAEGESLQKFDFQFLNAIRDVERDMFTGRNTLLKDVLDFFLDYDIKSHETKTIIEKEIEIKRNIDNFSAKSIELIDLLQTRMKAGKEQILSYAKETGASFNKAKPNFEGSISETELFSALKLIVEYETGIKIPATHNGLGYNNLIYMSLLLSKMQVNSDGQYLGSNAKVFPVLAIEEPEAHLHPAMQYKFLKFLRENKDIHKKVRQVFITTHSTQITSAVSLDEIICFHIDQENLTIGYPGKVFANDDSGKKAKAYVQRFLDATKSEMLFAQKVILVEGIAEQILMSILALYENKSIEDHHIAVINVGGRYFDYFLKLFDSQKPYTIHKRIVCLTDRDPERKKRSEGIYKRCYPLEYKQDTTNYEYNDHSTELINKYSHHPNIRFFSQKENYGRTFEYDIILHNPNCELLITDSINNGTEIRKLMDLYNLNKPISEFFENMHNSDEKTRINDAIESNTDWNEDDKKKAIIASRYLNSVRKGGNSLELSYILKENLSNYGNSEYKLFSVPEYIKQAIVWICQ